MVVRTYEFVKAESLCRLVPGLHLLNHDKTLHVVREPFQEAVDPPDFVAHADDVMDIGNGRDFGFALENGMLDIGGAFLARFDDAIIDVYTNTPHRANTFHVYVAPGVAIAETYSCLFSNQTLTRVINEACEVQHGDYTVTARIYDDEPVDQVVDGPAYLLASRFSFGNYFHFMVDVVPRLWALDLFDRPNDVPLLLPFLTRRSFVEETLRALGLRNPVVSLNCRLARIKTLYFPSFYSPGGYSREHVTILSRRLRAAFGVEGRTGTRRIYISRNDVPTRRVVNEDEVMGQLAPLGFERLTLSGMTVAEQAATFAEAEIVVAPHGAGNTNMLFAPPGATLIEVVPGETPNVCYWLLTKQNNQRYARLVCHDTEGGMSLRFDIDRLMVLVNLAIAR